MRVHVCIPHYVREVRDASSNPNGYGSLRAGGHFQRALALNRCLNSLLGLQRQAEITVLNIHHKQIDHVPAHQTPVELQISVCTDGEHQLDQVLNLFAPQIEVVHLQPEDPCGCLACRDHLIANRSGAIDASGRRSCDHDPAFGRRGSSGSWKKRVIVSALCPTVMNRCIKRDTSIARRWPRSTVDGPS